MPVRPLIFRTANPTPEILLDSTKLDRILLELVKAGLLHNEVWVQKSIDRLLELVLVTSPIGTLPQDNVTPFTMVSVFTCPWAIDYIEQCPILIYSIIDPDLDSIKVVDRRKCFHTVRNAFLGKPKLKALMAKYKLPKPLRKINVSSLYDGVINFVPYAQHINPSTLSQFIPEGPGDQLRWVSRLIYWCSHLTNHRLINDGWFEWQVRNGVELDVADYIAAVGPAEVNVRMSTTRIMQLSEAWHLSVVDRGTIAFQDLDYGAWPTLYTGPDGVEFEAIRSSERLREESRMMLHCVHSYDRRLVENQCRIYHVRDLSTSEKATLEISPNAKFGQLKGVQNAVPSKAIWEAVHHFIEHLAHLK